MGKLIDNPSAAGVGGGITNINVSAGATSNNLSALTFDNSNGVSFGITGSVITATVATNYQSAGAYLTTAALSGDTTKYAGIGESTGTVLGTDLGLTMNTDGASILYPNWLTTAQPVGAYLTTAALSGDTTKYAGVGESTGTVAGTALGLTMNTDGASIVYPNWLTTAQAPGAYLTTAALSGDTTKYAGVGESSGTVAGTDINFTMNTDGLSFLYPKYITTYVNDLTSGRAGVGESSGTVAGTDLNFTMNTDGLSILYPKWITTYAAGAGTGISGVGASDTTYSSGTVIWSGQNNVTIGSSVNGASQYVRLSVGNYITTGAASDHSHGNPTLALTNLSGTTASASNGFTLSLSAAAAGGGAANTFSSTVIGRELGWAQSSSSLVQNSVYFLPHNLQNGVSAIAVKVPFMLTNSSLASSSGQNGYTARFGIYTTNATNSTVLTLHYSTSYTMAMSNSSNASRAVSLISAIGNSTSYNSFTSSSAGLNLSSLVHGPREMILPISSFLSSGSYWFAWHQSSSGAGTSNSVMAVSHIIMSSQTQARFGVATTAVTGEGIAKNIGQGTYSVTSGALPNGVSLTQINKAATNPIFFIVPSTI